MIAALICVSVYLFVTSGAVAGIATAAGVVGWFWLLIEKL